MQWQYPGTLHSSSAGNAKALKFKRMHAKHPGIWYCRSHWFRISTCGQISKDLCYTQGINIALDVFFGVDIVLAFRTGYIDRKKNVYMEFRAVSRHYLRKWFLMDLIANFPCDIIGAGEPTVCIHAHSCKFFGPSLFTLCRATSHSCPYEQNFDIGLLPTLVFYLRNFNSPTKWEFLRRIFVHSSHGKW